jgi:hypothetical protein
MGNPFEQGVKDSLRSLAIEAAASPHQHAYASRSWGATPIDRAYVVRMWGEQAALAWDDIAAARKSFYRATEKAREAAP